MECPDENEVLDYVLDRVDPTRLSQWRGHLDTCEDCVASAARAVRANQASGDTMPAWETSAVTGGSVAWSRRTSSMVLAVGTQVGPYAIERMIGSGGMGVVYAARDPRLDRTIALKVIRPELATARAAVLERLQRESRALAKMSHPNVVTVFELGNHEDEIYVAMEYVAGTTLHAWSRETKRTPRAVLAMFGQAGRGLAAVHAAGLVHRDFKPENVLIGRDGSVKVTDFGLACALAAPVEEQRAPLALGSSEVRLTATGAAVGTPAYMAPEQFCGGVVDARADQFAFCVALYEALHGRRPFSGGSAGELRKAVLTERAAAVTAPGLPRRVQRAIARGLSTNADDRFATMTELLTALSQRRRFTTVALVGGGAAVAAAVATMFLVRPSEPRRCENAATEIATVWNPQRRAAIARAFAATNAPRATDTWTEADRALERYTTSWTAMHTSACQATRVHGQQSETVLDLRMACLARRRARLDGLLDELSRPDAAVVGHTRDAVAGLARVEDCEDVETLARRIPRPSDPAARRAYDDLEAQVERAETLFDVGRQADAIPILEAVLATPGLDHLAAIEATARRVRARIHLEGGENEQAEQALFRAAVRAQEARADDLAATISIDLAYVLATRLSKLEEARRWIELAAAAMGESGSPTLRARHASMQARLLQAEGKLPEAERVQRAAIELVRRHAPNSTLDAELHDALGTIVGMLGRGDEAVAMFERALTIREATYGSVHALSASTRTHLAGTLARLRRYDEARRHFDAALASQEALVGPDGFPVSFVLSNLGQMLQEQGKLDEARAVLERALAIREKVLGPDHPQVARTLANLAFVDLDMKAFERARARFERADKITVAALGPDHPSRADQLEAIGLTWIGSGAPARAIAPIERALALRAGTDPVSIAGTQANLARALWTSGRDRGRGRAMATAARAVLVEAGETNAVSDLDGWLR